MKIIVHRGTKEIGGSSIEVFNEREKILFEIGLPLWCMQNRNYDVKKLLPSLKGEYSGLFISHSHLDHYGLINELDMDIPVYLGAATKDLIEFSSLISNSQIKIKKSEIIEDRKVIFLASFKITPYLVDHSAVDSYAFLIESGGKKIFYSGDFRRHGRKGKLIDRLISNPPPEIDALILEGTNISRLDNANKETDIEEELTTFLQRKKKGITLLMASGQNLDRIVSIYKSCLKSKKTFVIDPYLACILDIMAKYGKFPHLSSKYRNLKLFFSSRITTKLMKANYEEKIFNFRPFKITKEEINQNRDEIVMLIRPNMEANLKSLNFEDGTLIWSMWKGYENDERNRKFLEFLKSKGVEIIREIHTSGHADIETLKAFVKAFNPKSVIPIHTAEPEKYSNIFEKVKMVNDEEEFEI